MEIINAIILAIIQGLTEFLPVSSSGHLEIAKNILGDEKINDKSLLMTVVLHFGTALSTLVIFRKDITEIFIGLFKFKQNKSFQYSLKIILSMIPATILGFFFHKQIESLFSGDILLVGWMLIITGILLILADQAKKTNNEISFKSAFIIGISQAIAILPGISRSGATISTSVLLGVDKEKSARFSFLMVVPLIFGKIIQDLLSGEISVVDANFTPLLIGFVFSFLTGLFACKWMITLVKNSQLKYFSLYCFVVGFIVILIA